MSDEIEGFRLGSQQKRLWLSGAASTTYRSQCAVLMEGQIEPADIERSLHRVVARHDVLRTSFRCLPGMEVPLQIIAKHGMPVFEYQDLSNEPVHNQDAQIEQLFQEEELEAFDLERGPVVRSKLLRLSANRHVMLISLPALCADNRTLHNIVTEIGRDLIDEEPGEDPLQYVQFSEWQNDLLDSKEAAIGREYWCKNTVFGLPTINLPFESQSSNAPVFLPAVFTTTWTRDTISRLDAVAPDGVSVAEVLLTSWQVLLWRLTKRSQFAISIHGEGRTYDEMQAALGLYASWPLIAAHSRDNFGFTDVLQRMRSNMDEALSWQEYYSWEAGGNDCEQGGRSERIGFAIETWPDAQIAGSLRISFLRQCSVTEPLKLQLSCRPAPDGLHLGFHYDRSRYSADSIQRLAAQFAALVNSVLIRPEAPISELDILGAHERQHLLVDWNATHRNYPQEMGLHHLFEQQVARTPEAIALVFGDQHLSFFELNARANQVAHYLRRHGAGPEQRVVLYIERSLDLFVALMGVLKAGAVYVPIDPLQPSQRVAFLVADSQARWVLTQESLRSSLSSLSAGVICLDADWQSICQESITNPALVFDPHQLAYLIYTSGSTGQPKGVMVEHRSVFNLLGALKEVVYEPLGRPLRVGLSAPIFFDASVKQIIQMLLGHTLDILPEEVRLDAQALRTFQASHSLDMLDCTPTQLKLWGRGGGFLPQQLLVGGEVLDSSSWQELATDSHVRAYNVYGPTECTVDATLCRVEGTSPSIGRPLPNVQVYVLDAHQHPTPIGVPGELYIAGMGLARGYVQRPDLTAERFVPNPFATQPGERLYRTGDQARWHPQGHLEFLGRLDHQVKLRGFRIELGEIEAVLGQHPGVEDTVVVMREDEPGDQRLVGYVVPRGSPGLDDHHSRYRLPNGLQVTAHNKNELEYLYHEIFEKQSYLRHGLRLPAEACVLDVGANIGLFSLFVKSLRPQAKVYAFEPIPPLFDTLRANVTAQGPHVRLFPIGLSNIESGAAFTFYPRYTMMSGLAAYAQPEQEKEVIKQYLRNQQTSVGEQASILLEAADELLAGRFKEETFPGQLRRLSCVLREERIQRVDLLKVDVQRAELDVLEGIEAQDWEKIEQLVVEVHDRPGSPTEGRVDKLLELLRAKKYAALAEQDESLRGTDRYMIYASRAPLSGITDAGQGIQTSPNGSIVALSEPGMMAVQELRDFLTHRLPDYMIPSAFVVLERLPLTRHGKVDRAALPSPEQIRLPQSRKPTPPRTTLEEVLAGIWAQVLHLEQVGIEDNFFELGGHSLLATQLMSRVRACFHLELPLRSLFEAPTIAALALRVEAALRTGLGLVMPPLQASLRDGEAPLSFAQERLWFLDQFEPNSAFYNIWGAARLTGLLDIEALEWALDQIVRRHEVLRTTFSTVDGRPQQIIAPPSPLNLSHLDLQPLPAAEREFELQRLAAERAQQPFDLCRGPLFRATLIRLRSDEHVLLLSLHHIVADGWSLSVMVRELKLFYQAFRQDSPSPLPALPIQYADYAIWQRKWLHGQVLEAQLDYWRDRLKAVPALLELPTDRPRPAQQSFRGARSPVRLSPELTAALKALGRQHGSTLFMTLLAAFQILLQRYSAQNDIVVGTPIAGRTSMETEELIGFFVNTLVLRSNLSGNLTFCELLAHVREVALGAYAHQDLPFEKLIEELQPERSLSHSPLFQVMFMLQNAPDELFTLPGLTIRSLGFESQTAKFDLTLSLTDTENGLVGVFEYNTDLWDASTIQRMIGHWECLLGAIVADPNKPIARLDILTETERQQLLLSWNPTQLDFPHKQCLHHLFEQQVEKTPDAVAVIFEDQSLTYGELNRRANCLARHLQSLGVGPEILAGLCVERSLDIVVGLLAILKAGGAYVALDPTYPEARLAFVLEDCRTGIVLTHAQLVDRFRVYATNIVCLDADWPVIEQNEAHNLETASTDDNLAYVIYTSGSTGCPKGVGITHQSTIGFVNWTRQIFPQHQLQGVLASSSICFDLSVFELFAPLGVGGTVILVENILQLSELPSGSIVTLINTVPSGMTELIRLGLPRTVRTVNLAGEPLSTELVQSIYQHETVEQVFNLYGPSEYTTYSTFALVPKHSGQVPAIGRPIANTQVYVLDESLQPVPIGVPGELYIGGVGLARGYLRRPGLTAERFVPNPFGNQPGERLYRTGDRVRWLPDGQLDFLGRLDHQVKLRGFRIELGEIESALRLHPNVQDAIVLVREDSSTQSPLRSTKRLVAYIVPKTKPGSSSDELSSFLQAVLPDYMLPSAYVTLEHLPLTPNGKVDRHALPAPDRIRVHRHVAARNPIEAHLVEIWSQVLGLPQIGIHDNFFELGGDSILSIQIVSRASQRGLHLTVKQIFEHQSIAALAACATLSQRAQPPQGLVSGPVPLTPIQHWFFAQVLAEAHHFNQAVLLEVKRPFHSDLLHQALIHLLEHHDALRLRFEHSADAWHQSHADWDGILPFLQVDLSGRDPTEQRSALTALAAQAHTRLDLTHGPLVQAVLVDLGPNQPARLLLIIHHLLVDGVSWRILLEDLSRIYDQLDQGLAVSLPAKTTSFQQWAEHLCDYAQTQEIRKQLDYWLEVHAKRDSTLPIDYPDGTNTVASSRTLTACLSPDETRVLLHEVPNAYRTEINDVLLTALAQAFQAWTHQPELLVDLEGHGREEIAPDLDLSRTVGWFTTIYPVRLVIDPEQSPGEALKAVKEQLRRIPQRGLGYGLLRYLHSDRQAVQHLQSSLQPAISFNYLGQYDSVLAQSGTFGWAAEETGSGHSPHGIRSHLLAINCLITGGQLRLNWTYSAHQFEPATLESLIQRFMHALRALIAHCQSSDTPGFTPSDFPNAKFSQSDLDQLVTELQKSINKLP